MIYKNEKPAILIFNDGTYYEGIGIGATKKVAGEITFSTIPGSGYVEILTDSTHKDQIVLFTYPLIGNFGVPAKTKDEHGIVKNYESDSVKLKGIIMNEYCEIPHHYESVRTLEDWMIEEGIPGIQWVDTRSITQEFVATGSKLGMLQVFDVGETPDIEKLKEEVKGVEDPTNINLVERVSVKNVKVFKPPNKIGTVVVLDLGVKNNIIRTLLAKDLEVIIVPYNTSYEKVMKFNPNGVLLSNGPGNPDLLSDPVNLTRRLIDNSIPTMGIGLGNTIMGLAAGASAFKMTAEHRGGRTTVESATDLCYITFHNHNYCLKDVETNGFKQLYHDKDDNTNEGIIHESKPIFGVAFNPEASPGALDTKDMIFNKFIENMGVK